MRGHTNALGTRLAAVILPRSGLGTKGLVLANSVGLVDEDYNAEIKVVLHNTSNKPFTIRRGDRIAQLMFVQVPRITFKVVHEFTAMASGRGGFGSTGVA